MPNKTFVIDDSSRRKRGYFPWLRTGMLRKSLESTWRTIPGTLSRSSPSRAIWLNFFKITWPSPRQPRSLTFHLSGKSAHSRQCRFIIILLPATVLWCTWQHKLPLEWSAWNPLTSFTKTWQQGWQQLNRSERHWSMLQELPGLQWFPNQNIRHWRRQASLQLALLRHRQATS